MAKGNTSPADDLEVLFPDRSLAVGGKNLIVRELRFEEQLRHHHLLKPVGDAFAGLPAETLQSADAVNHILDLLIEHWETIRDLVALSCAQPLEWISALPPEEGEALLLTWWAANQSFFFRRLWRPALVTQAEQGGETSSLFSSKPGIAASI